MSDFVSGFWDIYVKVIVLASVVGCAVFLWLQSKGAPPVAAGQEAEKMDHVWDETLQEYNNPLPLWWSYLFYITVVFALVYLVLYPGFGSFKGVLGWTSYGSQYGAEMDEANNTYGPIFDKYAKMDLKAVAASPEAKQMGERLFLTYCAQCHGSDAKGAKGFPNLADGDWLYGGSAQQIEASIADGRNGVMPAWGPQLGADGVKDVTAHVLSLSGKASDSVRAARGKEIFTTNCNRAAVYLRQHLVTHRDRRAVREQLPDARARYRLAQVDARERERRGERRRERGGEGAGAAAAIPGGDQRRRGNERHDRRRSHVHVPVARHALRAARHEHEAELAAERQERDGREGEARGFALRGRSAREPGAGRARDPERGDEE